MISNTRRVKAEKTIDNIVAWLRDELKYDSLVVNGTETMTDGSDDIILGRYEVCRDLLHYINSIHHGESHDKQDESNTYETRNEKNTRCVSNWVNMQEKPNPEWREE